jgi:hypothetical protein
MDGRSAPSKPTEGSLGKEVQASLGILLRDHYQKIVKEGVPDRFADLLQRYEQKVQGPAAQGSAEAPDIANNVNNSAENQDEDPAA